VPVAVVVEVGTGFEVDGLGCGCGLELEPPPQAVITTLIRTEAVSDATLVRLHSDFIKFPLFD
jgi:hypothetical protein